MTNSPITSVRRFRCVAASGFAVALIFAAAAPARLTAQDNVLDLRMVEVDSHSHVTYQNFIYSHNFDGGQWMAQALYLRLPTFLAGPSLKPYNELSAGVGYRVATLHDVSAYVIAGWGSATDGNYFEPALFVTQSTGKLTGDLFFQKYAAVTPNAVGGLLIDPLELQYAILGPFSIGAALYAYQPVGGDWLTKVGGKLGLNDKLGTTEVRISHVSTGGEEFQLRRIFVF